MTSLSVVKFLPLETIEEEADQTLRSHVREDEVEDEDEDEDLLMPVEVEAKPAEAEREEDQVGLQVLRQRRKKSSGQMSRNSSPSLQVRLGPYEDGRARAHGSHDESGKKRSRTYRKSTGRTVKNHVSQHLAH